MKKTVLFLFMLFLGILNNYAQNVLNNYAAISIPERFEFQNSANEYNLNQTIKASLKKYNFKAFILGDEIPESIEPCQILRLKINKSGFLINKMSLSFYDCLNNNVYTSIEGLSRIKEYKPSYYESIGLALKDPNIVNHQYTPKKETTTTKKAKKTGVAVVEKKKETLGPKKENIVLELRGKQYKLVAINNKNYQVYQNNQLMGTFVKQADHNYIIKAGSLTGAGKFDDFGNFILTRTNPANQAVITDTMVRVN